jgi:serine/threonine-protein kinase HipA
MMPAREGTAPSLAPLYDLVSTAVYDEVPTRLAMSIDGAKRLEEVRRDVWVKLAAEIDFAPRYVAQRLSPFVEQVVAAADALAARPEHEDEIVWAIVTGVRDRAAKLL